jgi:hypothetical protein
MSNREPEEAKTAADVDPDVPAAAEVGRVHPCDRVTRSRRETK